MEDSAWQPCRLKGMAHLPPLAGPNVCWTAVPVEKGAIPGRWGELRGAHVHLKDTGRGIWNNRLEAPNRYVYQFPTRSKWMEEGQLIDAILSGHDPTHGKFLRVRLYATPGSREECYGEWASLQIRDAGWGRKELVLGRLKDQPCLGKRTISDHPVYRSANEATHAEVLRLKFPEEDWMVVHEPETLLDLHAPSVVDGISQSARVSTYTCDFVVCSKRGMSRLCVESKFSEAAADEVARIKCRMLRDKTYSRVCILAGRGHACRWLDFGTPSCPTEEWMDEFTLEVSEKK